MTIDEQQPDQPKHVLQQYKKPVVGLLALVGLGFMIRTVRRRAANNRLFDQTIAQNSVLNPRHGAYIFAIQTFTTATTLVGCAAVAISMTVASVMNVNSFQEFSVAIRSFTQEKVPWLQVSGDEDSPENIQSTKEFMEELAREYEIDEEGYKETPTNLFLKSIVKKEMGPLVK
ncbi:hypothetical protein BATDEDRAFT_88453 [Batrachochytrium dendrobatidis JAM81]|uniref:Altered inheritance of mitochondria protein 11 n=2 Tax=Batrachochytrium dendrobatidis TaxID=109871 RepID=F4P274_BATDJ|nr:uncharacterized protein BATDEDRAFT_88453 [Batrachochytrium dendrobatidis JAM81]EGF80806.1 hypothetical protein BATDEDRAFT_88453 [Batrachochytrium dendrobatidis JAM81]KAJ8329112.1 hypothetical protein O5D80_003061 [Batrachochytrium dendrobatidis]KAK5669058.1 hypothetical protein QVD99_004822 [Batrachochytrium dendrobatidis]OAJ41993.1 hypothetical protein BDEG_25509 [Batrachochytrium dendrobatidis JEL423]|eukprot:XP_006678704.1 hypothetical protein BATDEDRAFT_88453 [Batrachochytrium dendrobatidis JAM81]